jgi:glycosyltransferase involved in cell wall biosynthesis
MEGGAHVVIEALRSGTPVLASRIDGNLGLLGEDWPATFDVGDDAALAGWLIRLRESPGLLDDLRRRAVERAALFSPEHECRTLLGLVRDLL